MGGAGEHYRSVLDEPQGTDHGNIRAFLKVRASQWRDKGIDSRRGQAWGPASTHTHTHTIYINIIYTFGEVTSWILRSLLWESLTSCVSPVWCVLCYGWQTGWAGVSFPQGLALKPASQ